MKAEWSKGTAVVPFCQYCSTSPPRFVKVLVFKFHLQIFADSFRLSVQLAFFAYRRTIVNIAKCIDKAIRCAPQKQHCTIMLFPMQDDVKILETLFLDAVFPIIYTLARSFTPFPCLECTLNVLVHPSHSCQLPEEDVHFKPIKLASVQVQQHILELLTNINDILK